MRAVVVLVPDSDQDSSWFTRLENRHDLIGLGVLEVLVDEVVPAAVIIISVWRFQYRSAPFLGAVLHKVLELVGNTGQKLPGNPLSFTVGIEKPQHSLWLLERLDQSVQQDSIEASIAELNAIPMVLEEGVHGNLQCGDIPGGYSHGRLYLCTAESRRPISSPQRISRAEPLISFRYTRRNENFVLVTFVAVATTA